MRSCRFALCALLAALCAMPLVVQAQDVSLVDNLEDGNGTNEFGGKWRFGDDSWAPEGEVGGNSLVLSAKDPQAEWISYDGNYGGGYNSQEAALLHYRLGDRPNPFGQNNVSIKTGFAEEEYGTLDMSGSIGFSFYAKADQSTTVKVSVASANITDWAFSYTDITVGTEWRLYEIPWSELQMPDYTENPKPFDPSQAQYIEWKVSKGSNTLANPSFNREGKLWIDDVVVVGYRFVPGCTECLGMPGSPPEPSVNVINFEFEHPYELTNDLGLGTWGYASQDPNGGVEPTVLTSDSVVIAGSGYAGTNGMMTSFTFGDPWKYGGQWDARPAVKYHCDLAKKDDAGELDSVAFAQGASALYFDYMTSGDVKSVRVEFATLKIYQESEIALPSAVVPGTEGEWKSATITWDKIKMPYWGVGPMGAETFNINGMRYLEWIVEGNKGQSGSFALDNVYLIGLDSLYLMEKEGVPMSTRAHAAASKATGSTLTRTAGKATLIIASGLQPRTVSLLDMRGRVVSNQAVPHTARTVSMNLRTMPAGAYLLVLDARRANGAVVRKSYRLITGE